MDPSLSSPITSKKSVKLEKLSKIPSSIQNPSHFNQFKSCLNSSFKDFNDLSSSATINLMLSRSKESHLDIYSLFLLYSNLGKFYINIPTSMIKDNKSGINNIIQTKKNGRIYARNCHEKDFFSINQNNTQEKNPLFCIKSPLKDIQLFYSIEAAENAWKKARNEPILVQKFINGYSIVPSITRVLWRDGNENKYFCIASKSIQNTRLVESKPKISQASSNNIGKTNHFSKFRYSHMIPKTKKSHNTQFCIAQKNRKKDIRSSSAIMNENKWSCEKIAENRSKSLSPCKMPITYIVSTKSQEEYIVTENKSEIPEIDDMINQIVTFLNNHFCKDEKLKYLVADFIYNKNGKWVFLDCKEYSTQSSSPIDSLNSESEPKILSPPRNKRSLSEGIQNIIPLESIRCKTPTTATLPFKMKKNFNLNRTIEASSEQDLFERCNKLSQKIDYLTSLKPARHLNKVNFKEESIKAYQMRFNQNTCTYLDKIQKDMNRNDEFLISCPIFKQKPNIENAKNTLLFHKVNDHAQRHLLETNNNLDEMKVQCELIKVKRKDLIHHYGGDEFWNQFIMSLYKKVIENESLCKYFSTSSLNMIIRGMLKVFNGNATLEFRRTVRSAHQNLKICEKEFDSYSNIFESTLKEFHIEEDDRQMIMSQIKSMKCLICK
ncbi:unnamed protein product [Blepharisma stoltei]|uniref:Ig-like domain-containing protein n=1 Tax=Blepharisma stoltei TaxID=1481888 RepID=A0AAU9K695_9CILI|nr:unnamed protein product [Blepharisma stoltei]